MKVAIYSRKSKFTGIGDSIENQVQMCKNFIESKFKNENIEYYVFEDEGFTGSNTNRPEFNKMMDYVREGDIVYVTEWSRLSRSTMDLLTTLNSLENKGVIVKSIKENFDAKNS